MGLPRDELIERLREQIYYLESAAAAFDAGVIIEAKRLAVSLRVLLHNTRESHSLLGQLRNVSDLRFPCVNNSPIDVQPGTVFAFGGMYSLSSDGPIAKTAMSGRTAPFDEWWTETCTYTQSIQISRRSAVLALANQGGGAHIDPRLNSVYRRIAELKALGWDTVSDAAPEGGVGSALNNPLPQIARATTAEALALLRSVPF